MGRGYAPSTLLGEVSLSLRGALGPRRDTAMARSSSNVSVTHSAASSEYESCRSAAAAGVIENDLRRAFLSSEALEASAWNLRISPP